MTSRVAIAASVIVAIAIGFGYGAWFKQAAGPAPGTLTRLNLAIVLPSSQALSDFNLHDESGGAFGPEQLAGQWSLLFFGFSSCGDVCPTTLYTLAQATTNLPIKPRIIFLSVDPGRDSNAVLRQYLAGFDAPMLGVTGEDAQIRALAMSLGAAYEVWPDAGAYRVEHSPAVFVINPDGRYVAVFTSPVDAEAIATDLQTLVES